MSKSKHTPGPWKVCKYNFGPTFGVLVPPGHLSGDAIGAEMTEANARLIAAAPDLLEMLKMCERVFKEEPTHGPGSRISLQEYRLIVAAIRKAEGADMPQRNTSEGDANGA